MKELTDEQADQLYHYDWYTDRYGITSREATDCLEICREPETRAVLELWRERKQVHNLQYKIFGAWLVMIFLLPPIAHLVIEGDHYTGAIASILWGMVIILFHPEMKIK